MTTPHKSFEERVDEVLKEHIQIVGDGWWHPTYGLGDLKAALLAAHKEEVERVDRLEVIDDTGRAYVKGSIYGTPVKVELSYQDDGRTLKVFVEQRTRANLTDDHEGLSDRIGW